MYPKVIEGTWQFNGDWFGSMRLVATVDELTTYHWERDNQTCPICEYPAAYSLGSEGRTEYQLMNYCPECGSVWGWYVARCPDCDHLMWKKDCKDGELICSICNMAWDIESIKEINADPEFHNDGSEDD